MVNSICVSSVVRAIQFVIASSPWLNLTTKNAQTTVFAVISQYKQCLGCQASVSTSQIIISGEYMHLQGLETCAKFHDLSSPFEEDIALAFQPVNPQVYWAVCIFVKYM